MASPYEYGYNNDPRQWYYGYAPPPHGYPNHPPPRHYPMHPPPYHAPPPGYYPNHPPPMDRYPPQTHRNVRQPTVQCECKACGKTFVKESQLIAHNKTHIKCWHEGCDFSASKQVVNGHFAKIHGQYQGEGFKEIEVDGQKFTVLLGDSQEDIEKWRAERRKQWPTIGNISEKKKTMDARIAAGDIIEDQSKQQEQKKAEKKPSREKKKGYCKKFVTNKCTLGDQCDWSHDLTGVRCKLYYRNGKCPRGETCKFSHSEMRPQKRKAEETPEQNQENKRQDFRQKLLRTEIQQEHSDILQAFRYLVSKSFFDAALEKLN